VLSSPLSPGTEMGLHIDKHGDGVKDVSFSVDNAENAWKETTSRGAESVSKPKLIEDEKGEAVVATIKTYGDTIHSFVETKDYHGLWAPGYKALEMPKLNYEDTGLLLIDHIVGNVEEGKMNEWRDFYENIFGFTNFVVFDENDISTKFSSLKSRVMRSKNWKIKFPINEPASGIKKSQIEEYLDFNEGPGVQHVALLTEDIVKTITALRNNGLDFLYVPDTYYDELSGRVGDIDEAIAPLQELGILVDRDEEGYLLQLFSKPVEDRPTLFFEIIQRKGSRGFGQGNFQALFESIEVEQEKRGNL
jgi:4-hydroxyphenylpyruvate dioxygenase